MKNKKLAFIVVLSVAFIVIGTNFYKSSKEVNIIGGNRDEYGCLVAAGYVFDEEVGACVRAFELTSDMKRAAKLAVEKVGRGYALTVTSIKAHEREGLYVIVLERGMGRVMETVNISNGEIRLE